MIYHGDGPDTHSGVSTSAWNTPLPARAVRRKIRLIVQWRTVAGFPARRSSLRQPDRYPDRVARFPGNWRDPGQIASHRPSLLRPLLWSETALSSTSPMRPPLLPTWQPRSQSWQTARQRSRIIALAGVSQPGDVGHVAHLRSGVAGHSRRVLRRSTCKPLVTMKPPVRSPEPLFSLWLSRCRCRGPIPRRGSMRRGCTSGCLTPSRATTSNRACTRHSD